MMRVRLQDMSNADVDQYLGLLYKVVARYASGAPIQMPTRDQSAAAEAQLSRGIVANFKEIRIAWTGTRIMRRTLRRRRQRIPAG